MVTDWYFYISPFFLPYLKYISFYNNSMFIVLSASAKNYFEIILKKVSKIFVL